MDDKKQVNIDSLLKKLEQFKPQENVVKKKEETIVNSSDWYIAGEGKTLNAKDTTSNDRVYNLEKTLGVLDKRKKELELERKEIARLEALTPEEDKAVRKEYIVDKKNNVSFGDYQIKKGKNLSKIFKWTGFGAVAVAITVLAIIWILNMSPAIPDVIGFTPIGLTQRTIGEEVIAYSKGTFEMSVNLPSSFKNNTVHLTVADFGVSLSKGSAAANPFIKELSVKPGERFRVDIDPIMQNIGRVTIVAKYENTTKTEDFVVYVDRMVTSIEFAKESQSGPPVANITNPSQAESLKIENMEMTKDDNGKDVPIQVATTFYVGQFGTLLTKSTPELRAGTSNYRNVIYEIVPGSQEYDVKYNPELKSVASGFRALSSGADTNVIEVSPDGKYIIAKRPGVAKVRAKVQKWLDGSDGYQVTSKDITITVTFPVLSSYNMSNLTLFMGYENTFNITDVLKNIRGKYGICTYEDREVFESINMVDPGYFKELDKLLMQFKGAGWFNVKVDTFTPTISVKEQYNGQITLDPVTNVAHAKEASVNPVPHALTLHIGDKKLAEAKKDTGVDSNASVDRINIDFVYKIDFKADVSSFADNLHANILAFNGRDYVQFEGFDDSKVSFIGGTPFFGAFEIRYEIFQWNDGDASLTRQRYLKDGKIFAPKEAGNYSIRAYLQSKLNYAVSGYVTDNDIEGPVTIIPNGKLYFSVSDTFFKVNTVKLQGNVENIEQLKANLLNKLDDGKGENSFLTVTSQREFDAVTNIKNPIQGVSYISGANILSDEIISFDSADSAASLTNASWKSIVAIDTDDFNVTDAFNDTLTYSYENLPISDEELVDYYSKLIMSIRADANTVVGTRALPSTSKVLVWNNKVGTTNLTISFRTTASSVDEFTIGGINYTTVDNIISTKDDFTSPAGSGIAVAVQLDFKLSIKNLVNCLDESLLSNYSLLQPVSCQGGKTESVNKYSGINADGTIETKSGTYWVEGDQIILRFEIRRKSINWQTFEETLVPLEIPIIRTVTFTFNSTVGIGNS